MPSHPHPHPPSLSRPCEPAGAGPRPICGAYHFYYGPTSSSRSPLRGGWASTRSSLFCCHTRKPARNYQGEPQAGPRRPTPSASADRCPLDCQPGSSPDWPPSPSAAPTTGPTYSPEPQQQEESQRGLSESVPSQLVRPGRRHRVAAAPGSAAGLTPRKRRAPAHAIAHVPAHPVLRRAPRLCTHELGTRVPTYETVRSRYACATPWADTWRHGGYYIRGTGGAGRGHGYHGAQKAHCNLNA
jgi:hypothetical protein